MSSGDYGPLLDALRGVVWPARRDVRGSAAGMHPSGRRGTSPEFTEYRPYRQGDDPRRLDWKLLARTDRAYLRVTADDARLATLVLVDASASMAFPEGEVGKWAQARRLAVGLMAVAVAGGDPVGLAVPEPRGTAMLAPRTRRDVIAAGARLLDIVAPDGAAALTPALLRAPRAWRVAVISDFLGDDADALLRAARERVRAGGEVVAVHVVAREELEPPAGAVMAADPEHPSLRRALEDATRGGYQAAFAAWRERLAREWRDAGAVYAPVLANEPPARAVRALVLAGAYGAERGA